MRGMRVVSPYTTAGRADDVICERVRRTAAQKRLCRCAILRQRLKQAADRARVV